MKGFGGAAVYRVFPHYLHFYFMCFQLLFSMEFENTEWGGVAQINTTWPLNCTSFWKVVMQACAILLCLSQDESQSSLGGVATVYGAHVGHFEGLCYRTNCPNDVMPGLR